METDTDLDVKRIQNLADAVFAVAMTILILEIRVPQGLGADDLSKYITGTIFAELMIYGIGFITLGVFWIGSHFHHHILTKTDRTSSWLNILFLMMICMIPFSVGFLKNYRHEKLSVIFYSMNLICVGLLNLSMLLYAWKKKYVKAHFTKAHVRYAIHRILIPIYCYAGIMGIAFYSTNLAIYLYLLPIILHILPEKGNEAEA